MITLFNAFIFLSKCYRTITRTFIHKDIKRSDNFTTEQWQRLILLSGSVGSVWNDFITIFPLQIGTQHAAVLVLPYLSPFLFRPCDLPCFGFRCAAFEYSLRKKYMYIQVFKTHNRWRYKWATPGIRFYKENIFTNF